MHDVIGIQLFIFILGILTGGLALIGALFFFGLDRWFGNSYSHYASGWSITGQVSWWASAFFALILVIGLIPFDSKYHVYYKLTGKVESVSNVLENGGDGERTEKPVFRLSGYSDPIQTDDARIVTLKGREVELKCSYGWVYQGLDTTDCEIRAIK